MTTKLTTALNPISMMIQRGLIAFSPDAATAAGAAGRCSSG
jgi:hypothetical protein